MALPWAASFRFLLLLGYVLIPFMSLPILPSDYRPVSVLMFLVTGFLLLLTRLHDKRMPVDEFVLFCFVILCWFQSLIMVGVLHGDYVKFLRHWTVLVLGAVSYTSLKAFFQLYGADYALRLMAKVYILILALGVLEVLAIVHVLPWSVKSYLTKFLSGRTVQRVQLVTSEASWGAKVLLFGIPIYVFLLMYYRRIGYLIGLLIALLLFCFTLSLDGFIVAAIAVVFLAAMKFRAIVRSPKWCVFVILIVGGLAGIFYLSYRSFPKSSQYYMTRLQTLETLDAAKIRELPRKDGSVFIRVHYPLIGIWMFLDKPYGIGLGGYSLFFKQFIDQIGVDYTHFSEVVEDIRTQTGDPKSLYAKALSENGIYSGWMLILFFGLHLYYLKRIASGGIIPYRNLLIALFAVNLAILVQFGSYAFLPMWFTLALNTEIYRTQTVYARI